MYKRDEPALKVDDPPAELIRALQVGRLGASKQRNQDLPIDLTPKFWAWRPLKYVFAIDPIFERAKVLELWKADPVESAQVVETAAPKATKKQMQAGATSRPGPRRDLRDRIVADMKSDIESKKVSKGDLLGMKQEALAALYGAKSRETAVLARNEALSEISEK